MSDRKRAPLEIFVLVDEAGDYVVATDRDDLAEKWTDDIGDLPLVSRVLAISLDVELPRPTNLSAVVNAAVQDAVMSIAG